MQNVHLTAAELEDIALAQGWSSVPDRHGGIRLRAPGGTGQISLHREYGGPDTPVRQRENVVANLKRFGLVLPAPGQTAKQLIRELRKEPCMPSTPAPTPIRPDVQPPQEVAMAASDLAPVVDLLTQMVELVTDEFTEFRKAAQFELAALRRDQKDHREQLKRQDEQLANAARQLSETAQLALVLRTDIQSIRGQVDAMKKTGPSTAVADIERMTAELQRVERDLTAGLERLGQQIDPLATFRKRLQG